MIDMWSGFGVVEALENCSAAEKKNAESREETLQMLHVVNLTPRDDKHVVTTIRQPLAENAFLLLPQVLYCNLESHLCQVLFSINSALKI